MAKVLSQEQLFWCHMPEILVMVKSCSFLGSLGDLTINRNAYINCLNGQGAEPITAILLSPGEESCDSKKLFFPWFLGDLTTNRSKIKCKNRHFIKQNKSLFLTHRDLTGSD
jgi:hypothetical protein